MDCRSNRFRDTLGTARSGRGAALPCKTRRALLFSATLPALIWPCAIRAQEPVKVPRIGLLSPYSHSATSAWREAFLLGLGEFGWVDGKNINVEYRYAEGDTDRLIDLAADLVRLKVDIIVTSVTPDALAAQKATGAIPIVMAASGDPVATGLVKNLSRPGGNVTGLSQMNSQMVEKRLELLKEMIPSDPVVAVLWNAKGADSSQQWKEMQTPARQLGIKLYSLEISNLNDFDRAFEAAVSIQAHAIFITPDPLFGTNLSRIAGLAAKNRLPAIFHVSAFTDAGGLLAYGPDRSDLFRRSAAYVDKILKGAKPGDLPVEQPTKFELVVNVKAAKTLGIKVPQSILMRASKVIE